MRGSGLEGDWASGSAGAPGPVTLAELVACLALAADLGMGQPLDHCLRTCMLAVEVGRRMGLEPSDLADAYHVSLLRFVGCTSHARQDAAQTGDEIAFRAGLAPLLNGGDAGLVRYTIARTGRGLPAAARVRLVAAALVEGGSGPRESVSATCEVARMIAARLGLGEGVLHALRYTYEHHDGRGLPEGSAGDEIPRAARLASIARDFEILHRLGGRELVVDAATARRGRAYDPEILDGFLEHAWEVLERDTPGWSAVMAADPAPSILEGERLQEGVRVLADFADVRSPFTHGQSHRVAEVAERAAHGLPPPQVAAIRSAALVQELGMTGVPSQVFEKTGPLSESDWERIRLHPYLTERVLSRSPGLSRIGALAGLHHERLDGNGYHRGLAGSQLGLPARLLAAAGAAVALRSPRPWRPALSGDRAAATLRGLADGGGLDGAAVEAVLEAMLGEPSPRRRRWPAGLTDREVEVLDLVCLGLSNRQMAQRLSISTKTVGRHIENLYSKLGVASRAAATAFAVHHGLSPAGLARDPNGKMG